MIPSIKINRTAVKRYEEILRKAPAEINVIENRLLERFGNSFQYNITRKEAPRGVTGKLRGSINYDIRNISNTKHLNVFSHSPYAFAVHQGRDAYTPRKTRDLERWALSRGFDSVEDLINVISKRGTRANPFFDRTFNFLSPSIFKVAEDEIARSFRKIISF